MNVTVTIDLTPDEARRAMGLPDLTPLHERYIAMVMDTMQGKALQPELVETLFKSWSPMNEAGLALWRRLLDGGAKAAG